MLAQPAILHGPSDAIDVFRRHFADAGDLIAVALLDADRHLLGVEVLPPASNGLSNRAALAPALAAEAFALILVRYRPGSTAEPTSRDYQESRSLAQAAQALDLHLVDHLILGRNGAVSFRALGFL